MPPAPPTLALTTCPCGCRAPVLVDVARITAGVSCPTTRRRVGLPANSPLKVKFGRKQYDACRDVRVLVQAVQLLRPGLSSRKKRLLLLHASRVCLGWCKNPDFAFAQRAAERLATGELPDANFDALAERLLPAASSWERLEPWRVLALQLVQARPEFRFAGLEVTDPLRLAEAFHEVIANPFRANPVQAEWRTTTVLAVATQIDATGRLWQLPILADALEEAGCTDLPTLAHLREPAGHAAGCWALDWVQGRED